MNAEGGFVGRGRGKERSEGWAGWTYAACVHMTTATGHCLEKGEGGKGMGI
jgi:hypothetical protein